MGTASIKANKRVFDGIEFASTLELFCYKSLQESGLKFGYESEKFYIAESRGYKFEYWKKTKKKGYHKQKKMAVSGMLHTPDFPIYNEEGAVEYIIETKGYKSGKFQIYVKLFFTYASQHLPYLKGYYLPSNQKEILKTIEIIKSHE